MPSDTLHQDRATTNELEAYVVSVAFAGSTAAFALGDGTLHLAPPKGDWTRIETHDGAILAMAPTTDSWITAGDDGHLRKTTQDATTTDIATFGSKWVEQVATHTDTKTKLVACAVGKTVHIFNGDEKLKSLDHPSTVTGLAFDAKGKRIAASHYNGCSLWFVGAKTDTPRRLEWKGSHTGVALHPAGDAVVTCMQENSLHGWRLQDGQHMRMSGYPSKTESLSFSRNGRWLASSGADSVVLWPFFGGGPMGKAPLELAGAENVICTRVACHPSHDMVAAGFNDGMVVLADIASQRIIPVAPPGHGPVSALGWSATGSHLAFGTEEGFAALVDFTPR